MLLNLRTLHPWCGGALRTRRVDTIATIRIANAGTQVVSQAGSTINVKFIANPLTTNDAWTALSDGTIAIVRSQRSIAVDWIDTDGKSRSTPKMPFDWRRLTDAEKQSYSDSVLSFNQRQLEERIKSLRPGQNLPFIPELSVVPLNEVQDYLSPAASVRAGSRRELSRILPVTSLAAKNGKLYDIVNRKGEIFQRVQLPKDRDLAGFGRGGIIYLVGGDRANGYFLERVHLVAP